MLLSANLVKQEVPRIWQMTANRFQPAGLYNVSKTHNAPLSTLRQGILPKYQHDAPTPRICLMSTIPQGSAQVWGSNPKPLQSSVNTEQFMPFSSRPWQQNTEVPVLAHRFVGAGLIAAATEPRGLQESRPFTWAKQVRLWQQLHKLWDALRWPVLHGLKGERLSASVCTLFSEANDMYLTNGQIHEQVSKRKNAPTSVSLGPAG